MKLSLVALAAVLVTTFASSCGTSGPSAMPALSSSSPIPPLSLPPPWTPTASPAPPTLHPTATATPHTSRSPGCDLTKTLRVVKASIPYDQYSAQFLILQGTASLVVWYVDPALQPSPSASQLQHQLQDARLRAAELAATINSASPCSPRVFDVINPVVVDRRYQGWFSAEIRTIDLPTSLGFSKEELSIAADHFRPSYTRTELTHPYKRGTCEWPEALERLHSHFAADRELVAFYFVIDNSGSHVWAQWDGEANFIMATVNMANISLALECFSPAAELIYVIVNSEGEVLDLGSLPPSEPLQPSPVVTIPAA